MTNCNMPRNNLAKTVIDAVGAILKNGLPDNHGSIGIIVNVNSGAVWLGNLGLENENIPEIMSKIGSICDTRCKQIVRTKESEECGIMILGPRDSEPDLGIKELLRDIDGFIERNLCSEDYAFIILVLSQVERLTYVLHGNIPVQNVGLGLMALGQSFHESEVNSIAIN